MISEVSLIQKGLLSYWDLCTLVEQNVIENVDIAKVNSTSIDITLGDKILYEQTAIGHHISIRDRHQLDMVEFSFKDGLDIFVLHPNQFILAQSKQKFNLPNCISAEYKLKSSLARIGLEHMNAGWCDAGWHGSVLTLEFKNMTQGHWIHLMEGDPIGQVIFFKHDPVPEHASYANRGRYNNDTQVSGIKP